MRSKPDRTVYPPDMVRRLMLGVQEFRAQVARRLDAVDKDEHTVVARRGRPIAVLVPIEWYRKAAEKLREPTEF